MRLNGWMTKTPLCSCRMHSFSTAVSLPYTYRDCLFSCGRSRALHPQVALVHPTVGPFSFSMVRLGSPLISWRHRPSSLCGRCCFFCSGQGRSDSTSPDLPSWSQGNFPSRLQTSGLVEAVWSEASGYPPFGSLPSFLPPSLPPSPSASLYFCPHPTPPLLFFFSQLINYSGSVSHPHMNQVMSRG